MTNKIAFAGFGNTTLISKKKHFGRRMRLASEINNFRSSDLQTLRSLPERFQNQKHIEKFVLDAFKTRKREYFMLNGKLLDINHANKDVVSKVVLLLKHMKRDMKSLTLNSFVDDAFLNKIVQVKHQPAKEALIAAGNFFKTIGKGFTDFIFF